jgi:proteasome lid subunit RPN8/RPN11
MSGRVLRLPAGLATAIRDAAARAFPNECCGLIEGIDTGEGWQAFAIHEAANLSENPRQKFLVDPQLQFDLLRRLRGSARRIVGCFHSHPVGSAEPSATDRSEASESDFLYVIAAGGDGEREKFQLQAFVFDAQARAFLNVLLVG